MTQINRMHTLRYGKHTSVSSFADTPGTLIFNRPVNDVVLRPGAGYQYIPRDYQTHDNEEIPALRGIQTQEVPDVELELTGLSGAGAGDGTNSSTLSLAIGSLLECVTGAAVATAAGDTTDAVDAGTGTAVIMDGTPGGGEILGRALLVRGTTSGKYVAREIVSRSGATYTVDRALTTDTGTADTALEDEVVFGSQTFVVDNDAPNHTHFYLDSELPESRREFFGCMANVAFNFPSGGIATMNLSGIRCTTWSDTAEANPTYVAATTGSPIVVSDCPMWIGSTLYQAYDFSLDLGITFEPRRSEIGANGNLGYVVTRIQPKLTGKIREGTFTAPAEATDALLATWRGTGVSTAPTFDIGLQIGRTVGSAMYIRIPAARLMLTESSDNGQSVYEFEATATKSGNHSAVPGSMRLHFF